MRKEVLSDECIYHVFNRGVDKRAVFLNDRDHKRFVDGLIVFNDVGAITDFKKRLKDIESGVYKREEIVDILAFCLMPNHYHLLLRQRVDNGITNFMHKLGTGYAKYFNTKNTRPGTLFQGRFRAVLVEHDRQFGYIPYYIHLNCLGLAFPKWREYGLEEPKKAIEFLESYKWSSHLDYLEQENFPLAVNKEVLLEYFESPKNYKKEFYEFIKNLDRNLEKMKISGSLPSNFDI